MTETTQSQTSHASLYETDFYAWTQEQVKLLQAGQWAEIDLVNVIEEIDSLGKQQRQELENRLGVLLAHLLKWQFQPENRSNSWQATLREQRRRLNRLLKQNPSLKPYISEALLIGFENGRDLAIQETNLSEDTFPEGCPYDFEEAIDDSFFPD